MKLKRLKIKIADFDDILAFVFLYMYITPAYFLYKDPFATLYPIIRYGRCLLSIYFFSECLYRRKYKVDHLYLIIFLFCFVFLLSSLLGDLNLAAWINNTFQLIGCFAFAEYYRKRFNSYIKTGFWYFFLVLVINNILMALHPLYLFIEKNELGDQWYYFAASKNQFSMFCFPLLIFSYLAYEKKLIGKSILLISIVQAAIPPILAISVTSIVSVFLFEYKTYCYFSQNGCICDYIIVTNDKDIREKYKNLPGMVFVDKFSYRQNLLHASKTKNILELMQKNGTGYTIRACEAVALKKRLVSNNMFLERASFYSLDQFVSFDVVENVNVKKILKPYCEDSDEKYAAKMKELSPLSFMHRIDCDLGGTNKCLHPKA